MDNDVLMDILDTMDLPIQRKTHLNKNNLLWLEKNLYKKNKEHINYIRVMNEIQRRIENKEYYN